MNKKIITWSIAVGLGGLLFGMDVAVISGAEKTIQQYIRTDSFWLLPEEKGCCYFLHNISGSPVNLSTASLH